MLKKTILSFRVTAGAFMTFALVILTMVFVEESKIRPTRLLRPHLQLMPKLSSTFRTTKPDEDNKDFNKDEPISWNARPQSLSLRSTLSSAQRRSDVSCHKNRNNQRLATRLHDTCSQLDHPTKFFDKKQMNNLCKYAIHPCGRRVEVSRVKFIRATNQGQLCNQIFLLASSFGIAHAQNRLLCLSPEDQVLTFFHITKYSQINWSKSQNFIRATANHWARFDPCMFHLPPNHTTVENFLQSYKYFHHIRHKFRSLFRIRDDVLTKAKQLLEKLWTHQAHPKNKATVVGVHVRRGDMLWGSNRRAGHVVAPLSYYRKAFKWMVDALPDKDVVFVVVSEDVKWCEKYLSGSYVKIAPPAPTRVHLALLASCDHVIMSTGTFGWWGAYLAGGKTVYYKNYPRKGSILARGFKRNDFFLPAWVGLE